MANFSKLDRITATIVYELGSVGVFHYCKLAYLFEFFFIKNFGCRYTDELFIKLPHGPVIRDYKKQISSLASAGFFDVDLKFLTASRPVDDMFYEKIVISRNGNTAEAFITDKCAHLLLKKTLNKYASLSSSKLEGIVYSTPPVKTYLEKVKAGFKREIGGEVLSDCIKLKNYKTPQATGRMKAMEHLQKYPTINFELQHAFSEEFSFMKGLRPSL